MVFKIQSGGKFATFGAAQCIQNTENNVWSSPPPLYWKCSCKSILCFGNTLGKPTFTKTYEFAEKFQGGGGGAPCIRIGVMKDNFVFDQGQTKVFLGCTGHN